MIDLDPQTKIALIEDVALRRGTAQELSEKYGIAIDDLREWARENKMLLKLAAKKFKEETDKLNDTITPTQLSELWLAKKFDRILRYQIIADELYDMITKDGSTDPTVLREFRSYCLAAANELGQLLHRGSGESADGATVSYKIEGVNMDALK
jgi:hypothetical protein